MELTRHVGCGCMTETERFLVDRLLETELDGSSACKYKNTEIQKYKSFLNLNWFVGLQKLCYKFDLLFAFQNQSNEGRLVTILEIVMLLRYKIQTTINCMEFSTQKSFLLKFFKSCKRFHVKAYPWNSQNLKSKIKDIIPKNEGDLKEFLLYEDPLVSSRILEF